MVLSPLTWGTSALCASAVVILQKRRLGAHKRLVVVDAGSGSTRPAATSTAGPAPSRPPATGSLERCVPYVLGTAGGDALKARGDRDLGAASRDVEAVLRGKRGGLSFAVLDGRAEARLELAAVRFVRPGAGLFAGGGKSVQVASSPEDARSFAIDSFAGHELVRKHGAAAGARMHDWAVRRVVANELARDGGFARLDGAFSTIELVSNTLERAAAAGGGAAVRGPLARDAARDAVAAYRARLEKALNPNPNVSARGNDDAEAVKQLVYAVQVAALLELLFEKTASFEVLPFKGTAATPTTNWALGLYLEQREAGLPP
ncbi:diazepam binding inhibitor, acyl-CoA binding protein [Aureococcus anophagefferens]|uniref:Diazepam binding inhibitor, acyl-CoA binding protein n=1 Tax=Aureococcus anophagefferens TaxID=44056 RepID=A0ABR1G2Q6_AURAN